MIFLTVPFAPIGVTWGLLATGRLSRFMVIAPVLYAVFFSMATDSFEAIGSLVTSAGWE